MKNKDYWTKRGIPDLKKPCGFFKALYLVLSKKKNPLDFDIDLYNLLGKDAYGGTVDFGMPSLMLKDFDLIKHVLVKDFDHFVDRRLVQVKNAPVFRSKLS